MTTWAIFVIRLMPILKEIALDLYNKHKGDVEAAKTELRRIRDYGQQLDHFKDEIAERMAALKARAAEREAAK